MKKSIFRSTIIGAFILSLALSIVPAFAHSVGNDSMVVSPQDNLRLESVISKFYKEFPTVPNLGYYANVEPVNVHVENGTYIYQYDGTAIDVNSGYEIGVNWGEALVLAGFSNMQQIDDYTLVITNDVILVIYSFTDTELFVSVGYINSEVAAPETKTVTALPTSAAVYVNGEKIEFDAYNIDGSNYFKLRDVAFAINGTEKQFSADWDGEMNAISLVKGNAYVPVGGELTGKGTENKTALATSADIFIDGVLADLNAYNIDGSNYFKLRDIGRAFNFKLSWDGVNNAITVDTTADYVEE